MSINKQVDAARYLIGKHGLEPYKAAGIVANLVQESGAGLNHTAVGDNGAAYGLAQWQGQRQRNFKKVFGKSIRDSTLQEQLDYVMWELKSTERGAGKALERARTFEEATSVIRAKYERPANKTGEEDKWRISKGRPILGQLSGGKLPPMQLADNSQYGGAMTDTKPRDEDFSEIFVAWQPSNRFAAPKSEQKPNVPDSEVADIFGQSWQPSARYAAPNPAAPTAEMSAMTPDQLIAAYPAITGDVPPIPGTPEEAARARLFELQKAPPATTAQKAIGTGEAALSALTGATTGTAGMVAGTVAGLGDTLLSGKIGTQAGGENAQRIANEWAGALTYAPKTATGQQYAQNVGETLAPLQAVAPLAQMSSIGVMSKAAAAPRNAGIAAGKGQISTAGSQIENAKSYGVPVMTSDINAPTTWAGKMGQAVGERIPFAGTGGMRATQQAARQGAVGDFIRNYGGEGGMPAVNDVMANLLQKRGSDLSKYTGMKTEAINRNASGVVPVANTISAIDDQIAKLQGLNTRGVAPVITKLEDYKTAFQNQSLPNIEMLRKQLGEELKGADMASVKTTGEQVMRNVYGGLKQDMGDYIKQTGSRRDYDKWNVANTRLSEMIGETNVTGLKSALKKGEATPETIRTLLFSKKPSDVELLAKNLTPEGKQAAKTAIMQEAYAKIGTEASPERFISQMEKLSTQTGAMLTTAEKAELAGLVDALNLTKRAGAANVKPVTGAEVSGFAAPAIATYAAGGNPVAGLAATGAAGLFARAYESPAIRQLMVKMGKTTDRAEKRRLTDALLFVGSNPEAMGLLGGDGARKEAGLLGTIGAGQGAGGR